MTLTGQVETTDPALDGPAAHPSALRQTLTSPLYRGASAAVLLGSAGYAAAAPQLASFLVNDLGASLRTAGLFYLTNLTAPVAGYLVGRRSDRTGRRLGLFRLCAVLGFVGWLGIAYSTQLWMPFLISAVIGAFAGSAVSQLFAAIHDQLKTHPHPNGDGVVAVVRMALTAGWVIGPVTGAFVAAHSSLRTLLVAAAFCTLAQIIPLGTLRLAPADPGAAQPSEPRPGAPTTAEMLPLLAFTALFILIYVGEPIKYAFLPIYMTKQLNLPAGLSGAIIGIQPLVEIILMPLAIVAARRIGMMRLMVIGAGLGVAANICFATTGTAAGLFTGQILMGAVWGVFAALGILVAQKLLPAAVATASAVFISSSALASALGGAAGGLGAASIGLPHVFLIPAAAALLAAIGLAVMARRSPL
ncbi:putative sugar efflux transporter [Catellatospora sp. TT07R-123]|uniref:MFS transporter n=1 Tax=Catellatospora sp. TT07R-123 TaxID=2733863 RepID=UPI001AFE4197|nr:MFS transporter [Catellatospora sp. TT07R-123]GHJ48244.1 putative sugar efflux transporter [Catellatospora sp. TT07R-123]